MRELATGALAVVRRPSLVGPLLMTLGHLHLAVVPVLVRISTAQGVSSSQSSVARFAISLALVAGIVRFARVPLRTGNPRVLVWRGIFGGLAVLTYYYSLQHTTAAKGTLLNYTHSLWANLYAATLLGRKPPRGFWVVFAVAAAGLWLVLNPDFRELNLGDALGVASGMLGGGAILTIKELRKTDSALTIFASLNAVGMIVSLAPYLAVASPGVAFADLWMWPTALGWLVLAAMSAAAMLGQLLFTQGYSSTSIPLGTVLSLSVPALAALAGWTILGEPLEPTFLLGGSLVLTACGAMGLLEAFSPSRS